MPRRRTAAIAAAAGVSLAAITAVTIPMLSNASASTSPFRPGRPRPTASASRPANPQLPAPRPSASSSRPAPRPSSSTPPTSSVPRPGTTAPAPAGAGNLTFRDEFDGPAGNKPDRKKWTYDLGFGHRLWGNHELQTYTDDAKNAKLDGNGNLVITARKEGSKYTSARLKTEGIFSQKFGTFEARIKVPPGPGLLPAFWMMGNQGEWPDNGEIDIMENVGQEPKTVYGTIHGPGYSEDDTTGRGGSKTISQKLSADFHTYAVTWSTDKIEFKLDGQVYKTVTPRNIPRNSQWVFNKQPFHMLLNVAVGGDWPENPPPANKLPQDMVVDYIHVFDK